MLNTTPDTFVRRARMSSKSILAALMLTLAAIVAFIATVGEPLVDASDADQARAPAVIAPVSDSGLLTVTR